MKKLVLVALLSVGSSFSFDEDLTSQTTGLVKNIEHPTEGFSSLNGIPLRENKVAIVLRNTEEIFRGYMGESAWADYTHVISKGVKDDASLIFQGKDTNSCVVINGFLKRFSTDSKTLDSEKIKNHLSKLFYNHFSYFTSITVNNEKNYKIINREFTQDIAKEIIDTIKTCRIVSTNDDLSKTLKGILESFEINGIKPFSTIEIINKNAALDLTSGLFYESLFDPKTKKGTDYKKFLDVEKQKKRFFGKLKQKLSESVKSTTSVHMTAQEFNDVCIMNSLR